jgi:hypothetical protein
MQRANVARSRHDRLQGLHDDLQARPKREVLAVTEVELESLAGRLLIGGVALVARFHRMAVPVVRGCCAPGALTLTGAVDLITKREEVVDASGGKGEEQPGIDLLVFVDNQISESDDTDVGLRILNDT